MSLLFLFALVAGSLAAPPADETSLLQIVDQDPPHQGGAGVSSGGNQPPPHPADRGKPNGWLSPFASVPIVSKLPAPLDPFKSINCPTIQPVDDLNITEYTRASWYPQEMQETSYQSRKQLDCTVATYDIATGSSNGDVPGFRGQYANVYNWRQGGAYNTSEDGSGGTRPSDAFRLCASVMRPPTGALSVAPCFLGPPAIFGGDYWVIGVGYKDNANEYEWAVISGGPPGVKYADGCTTYEKYYNSGLWIFSRNPMMGRPKLDTIRQWLVYKGYSLQRLYPVRQVGCTYEGAFIKPDGGAHAPTPTKAPADVETRAKANAAKANAAGASADDAEHIPESEK